MQKLSTPEPPALLTNGEALLIKRLRAGRRQFQEARRRGVTEERIRDEENDFRHGPQVRLYEHELSPGEWNRIQRRRRGWTLARAAVEIGISRQTLWKAEHDRTRGVGAVTAFYVAAGPLHAAEPRI